MKFVVRHRGTDFAVEVERHGSGYQVTIDGKARSVDLVAAGHQLHSLRLDDGTQFSVTHHRSGTEHEVTLMGAKTLLEIIDPLALRRTRSDDEAGEAGLVTALMPGRIVRVLVSQGERVAKGTGLLILEAMKMENEIQAPADGTVETLFVQPGDTVERGASLIAITAE